MTIYKPRLADFQPPSVGDYHDPAVFQQELTLFSQAPEFVGHASFVPKPGDYYVLPQTQEAQVLLRGEDGEIRLLGNLCRHRQAVMLQGQGSLPLHGNVVCPIHQWSYNGQGLQISAPSFDQNPCRNLPSYPLH